MKKCSNDNLCFNPNGGQDVLLFNDEFHKDKTSPSGLSYFCKYCAKNKSKNWHKNNTKRHKTTSEVYYQKLINVLERKVNSANKKERDRPNKKKSTTKGQGVYDNVFQVLTKRTSAANTTSLKRDKNMITTHQTTALLISQDYICPITGFDISKEFNKLSLDHSIPDELGGKNVMENIILMHMTINLGKNGDYMTDALDIMLMIAWPDNPEKRKQRIDEIMSRIWDIQQIYPKVYEKIKDMKKKQLAQLLDNRVSVKDLLGEQWDAGNNIQKMKN